MTGISEDREWLQVTLDGASLWIFADLTDAAARHRMLLVVKASVCPIVGPSPSLACDKEILLSIPDTLAGRLPSWQPDVPLTDFTGVAVGGVPPRVIELNLNYFAQRPNNVDRPRLTGPIPPPLGRLSQLRELHLAGNQLTGIPSELGQLTRLRELDLSDNKLTGIPPELGQLTQLQYLYLDSNQLTGIPPN